MATMLVCAVIASMAGLLLPPVLKIAALDRRDADDLKSSGPAFAPE
ncbi:MAG TPA: hypothetical protein VEZ24_05245 [Microvirga sp.]|nr:hypothetical protein [Microvirga sp.]